MRASANPSLSSPPIPAPRWRPLTARVTTSVTLARVMIARIRLAIHGRRKRGVWQQDLPWDVGMDHLAETAYRPWILRP